MYGSGNSMVDAMRRGDGDDLGPSERELEAEAELTVDRVIEDVERKGRRSDLMTWMVQDEVESQNLLDFALDVALARSDAQRESAQAKMARWIGLRAQVYVANQEA